MALQTESELSGITIKHQELSGITETELKRNIYLIFCLIVNLGQVPFCDTSVKAVHYLYEDVLEYGYSAEAFAENEDVFIAFAKRLQDESTKLE